MSKKRTRHERLGLPKLDGTKKAKKAYNRAYWRKVTSKKRR
jgi:hypothetical protein